MNSLQVLNAFSYDPMIILTPLNNPKNTAYRVTQFTFETIIKEFKRAKDIIKQLAPVTYKKYAPTGEQTPEDIMAEQTEESKHILDSVVNSQQVSSGQKWSVLFEKLKFFENFNHFIKIDILSRDEESHRKWLGYVESQFRRLFQLFNDVKDIQELRLFPRAFQRHETKIQRDQVIADFKCADTYFIGIRLIMSQSDEGYQSFNLKEVIT